MKKYRVSLRLRYGTLEIDDVLADSESEAITKAEELVRQEVDCCKLDGIHEYQNQNR
jgi:hypothetical protein